MELRTKRLLDDNIRSRLTVLPPNWIVLFLVNSNKYNLFNYELLEFLVNGLKLPGIYVTVNKPYSSLKQALDRMQINSDYLLFIDAISRAVGEGKEKVKNCIFIENPTQLIDIGIALTEAIAKLKKENKKPFVFLDSLSTLLLYNSPETVGKFSHFTVTRMRLWGVLGIVMSLEDDVKADVVKTIKQFCDEVIIVA
jgi:KaiC/GvpD/RAD55 family RecA-like ATPase